MAWGGGNSLFLSGSLTTGRVGIPPHHQAAEDIAMEGKHARPTRNPFSDGIEVVWKTLGEVGKLIRGNGMQKKDFTETGVPAIHYGQIYTYYGFETHKTLSFVSSELAKTLKKVNHGDVVITNTSENLEDVGKAVLYLGEKQAVTGGHATIFKPNPEMILGKYFVYCTQSAFFAAGKRKYAKGTKVIDVSATDMAKIKIPIPPLETQTRIVAILDKFDALTHSISDGLPREIELRQKQYEYYRERLLTFA
ncbi:restriction endonuclease subunit S [Neisseria leonii]|uniref:restriction endonuclease subunit S n=1 Tax=Neisseria leonii TaxID=2995413 RepID=UPI00237A5255|nr:restriction endonuclease subunit S [Neisseria sp. 3986]MDD9325539.1 restriction endonuclease subunit S [Neisseria sp. 3986]